MPIYEKQLKETEVGITNMLNAIQMGILTSSTKERLEALEDQRKELQARIAEERLAKPKMKEEFVRFWLLRFRKLDMTQPEQRQALVDTFINAIYLYDDKVLITFNYKEGTETVAFGEAMKAEKSSDMSARGAPQQNPNFFPAQTAYRKDAFLIGTIFENCDKNSKGTEYPRGKPVPLPFSIILHRALLLRYHSAGRCSRDGYSQS